MRLPRLRKSLLPAPAPNQGTPAIAPKYRCPAQLRANRIRPDPLQERRQTPGPEFQYICDHSVPDSLLNRSPHSTSVVRYMLGVMDDRVPTHLCPLQSRESIDKSTKSSAGKFSVSDVRHNEALDKILAFISHIDIIVPEHKQGPEMRNVRVRALQLGLRSGRRALRLRSRRSADRAE